MVAIGQGKKDVNKIFLKTRDTSSKCAVQDKKIPLKLQPPEKVNGGVEHSATPSFRSQGEGEISGLGRQLYRWLRATLNPGLPGKKGGGTGPYPLRDQETEKRQKTLLASLLLSLWAPLATGIAVIMGHSVTQFADFIRRTVEFLVLLLSWLVFRYLARGQELSEETKKKWERVVNLSMAFALGVSGLIMLFLALFRLQNFRAGGNVVPGLVIVALGLGVNIWFFQRYSFLERAGSNPIINAQRRLYLAKIFVDLCVVSALGAVVFIPAHNMARHIDTLGSLAVSLYLLWSSFQVSATIRKPLVR